MATATRSAKMAPPVSLESASANLAKSIAMVPVSIHKQTPKTAVSVARLAKLVKHAKAGPAKRLLAVVAKSSVAAHVSIPRPMPRTVASAGLSAKQEKAAPLVRVKPQPATPIPVTKPTSPPFCLYAVATVEGMVACSFQDTARSSIKQVAVETLPLSHLISLEAI